MGAGFRCTNLVTQWHPQMLWIHLQWALVDRQTPNYKTDCLFVSVIYLAEHRMQWGEEQVELIVQRLPACFPLIYTDGQQCCKIRNTEAKSKALCGHKSPNKSETVLKPARPSAQHKPSRFQLMWILFGLASSLKKRQVTKVNSQSVNISPPSRNIKYTSP